MKNKKLLVAAFAAVMAVPGLASAEKNEAELTVVQKGNGLYSMEFRANGESISCPSLDKRAFETIYGGKPPLNEQEVDGFKEECVKPVLDAKKVALK